MNKMRGEVNKLKVLIALIIIFQGFSIGLLSHPLLKTSPWLRLVGWAMMIGGVWYIYFLYHARKLKREEALKSKESGTGGQEVKIYYKFGRKAPVSTKYLQKGRRAEEVTEPVEESILNKIMNSVVKKSERFSTYTLPIIGAIIIDAVIVYNLLLSKNVDLKGWDMITIMFGASLIVYNYIPVNFAFARDFFVFFLGLLFLILVFPPIFYELFLGSGGSAQVTKILLADPVSGILNLGGIDSYTQIAMGGDKETAYIYFPLLENGQIAGVGIDAACSGIYTASIFLAAFITFVLVEYKRLDIRVGIIIGLGILTTYVANILRMLIIVLVGHYYDSDPVSLTNLSWAHENAGWLIFMAWIIPFWWLMYRFLMRKDLADEEKSKAEINT